MAGTTLKSGSSSAKRPAEHPPYESMIKAAILSLKERKGSSRPAIKKYILANYKVSPGAHFDTQVSAAIKRGASKNVFALPKGLSGTVKLVKPEKKAPAEKKDKKEKPEKKVAAAAEPKVPATSTAKKSAPKKPLAVKKTAAAKKAALAKKKPSKEKTSAKGNVKAPKKKTTTAAGAKKTAAAKKKTAATKA
ncbi:hypothetical protein BX666DRAFT_2025733 [Dichotomocladium elegans]|nr:hypothetical protein BX666DRAFT_2025733 [Dichotomocladium elegans]